tara:strand:+ start:174 stop:371 length:198 start_codon:yes stop_codon:yes gene_type:complete
LKILGGIKMKLSNQAMGAIMMALQKSLMEQSDITEMFRGFDLVANDKEELVVTNPPVVELNQEDA